jgi:DNA-binding XRE family transcriptional regulator
MLVACLWDLHDPAPAEQVAEAPTSSPAPARLPTQHLIVLNPAHYQAIRESLAHNTFTTVEGVPWPTAPIDTGPARGLIQLRPVTLDAQSWMSPEDTDRWAARMWEQRKELSDLDADALDALCALWLTHAQRVDEDVVGDIDELLAMRGLQPKRNGAGQAGGYRPEQREAMWRAVLHVQNLWVHLSTMEVYQYLGIRPRRRRHQPTEETVQSRVVAITDRLGHLRPDGFFDVEKFIFRPGKVFAHFLFGTGRQTALLAAQALHYDPVQQTWEKRLARYLSYQWRCKAHGGDLLQPFQVVSLLTAVGATLTPHHPARTRARLEQALEILRHDRIIAAWQYDRWDEACATRRGWGKVWLHATILIEPPESVRTHYQHLTRHEARAPQALPAALTLSARLRQRREQLGLTLTQVAEQLGVSPSYLHRLEQGHRGKRLPTKLQQHLETWLATSLSQDEVPSA